MLGAFLSLRMKAVRFDEVSWVLFWLQSKEYATFVCVSGFYTTSQLSAQQNISARFLAGVVHVHLCPAEKHLCSLISTLYRLKPHQHDGAEKQPAGKNNAVPLTSTRGSSRESVPIDSLVNNSPFKSLQRVWTFYFCTYLCVRVCTCVCVCDALIQSKLAGMTSSRCDHKEKGCNGLKLKLFLLHPSFIYSPCWQHNEWAKCKDLSVCVF